jgi:hypothetical protein
VTVARQGTASNAFWERVSTGHPINVITICFKNDGAFERAQYLPMLGLFPLIAGKIQVRGTSMLPLPRHCHVLGSTALRSVWLLMEADTAKSGFMALAYKNRGRGDFTSRPAPLSNVPSRSANPYVTVGRERMSHVASG